MGIWVLEDLENKITKDKNEVYIFNKDHVDDILSYKFSDPRTRKWLVYTSPKIEFRLLQEMHKIKLPSYDENDKIIINENKEIIEKEMLVPRKTIGYLLRYKYDKAYMKFNTFNSFGILYNMKDKISKKDISLKIIYEDKIVRLLAYEHKNKLKDFWLIGRWRNNNTIDDDI